MALVLMTTQPQNKDNKMQVPESGDSDCETRIDWKEEAFQEFYMAGIGNKVRPAYREIFAQKIRQEFMAGINAAEKHHDVESLKKYDKDMMNHNVEMAQKIKELEALAKSRQDAIDLYSSRCKELEAKLTIAVEALGWYDAIEHKWRFDPAKDLHPHSEDIDKNGLVYRIASEALRKIQEGK